MTIETVYPDIDSIYADLIELLDTEAKQMKAYAQDIAKANNRNLFEAAEVNAKADGMLKALYIIRSIRIEAMRSK